MADATEGRLAEWSPVQRHEFNLLRARNYKITDAARRMAENYEDLHEYAYTTLASYAKSVQGQQEYERALRQVREEASKKSFTHRGSRLDTLIEVGNKLLGAFRTSVKVVELTKLAGEIRDTMREIRQEVDPLGLESEAVASHFDKIFVGFNKLDERQKRMLSDDEFWKDQTQEIERN